jgi:hypothetical protein
MIVHINGWPGSGKLTVAREAWDAVRRLQSEERRHRKMTDPLPLWLASWCSRRARPCPWPELCGAAL